jgi:hypothetical protein
LGKIDYNKKFIVFTCDKNKVPLEIITTVNVLLLAKDIVGNIILDGKTAHYMLTEKFKTKYPDFIHNN